MCAKGFVSLDGPDAHWLGKFVEKGDIKGIDSIKEGSFFRGSGPFSFGQEFKEHMNDRWPMGFHSPLRPVGMAL